MNQRFYHAISAALSARINCERSGNKEWFNRHTDRIETIVKNHAPSGSGFDNGTQLDIDSSRPDRLVFTTAFHHMDVNGYYCGWSDHKVIVTPCFDGYPSIRVSGRDMRQIKDYISEVFHTLNSIEI